MGHGKTALHKSIGDLSREMFDSLAMQREAFLAQHADKIGTHTLVEYSTRYESAGNGFQFRQQVSLVPRDYLAMEALAKLTGEPVPALTSVEAARSYPTCVLTYTLEVKLLSPWTKPEDWLGTTFSHSYGQDGRLFVPPRRMLKQSDGRVVDLDCVDEASAMSYEHWEAFARWLKAYKDDR